jgi:hypothetical protein
MADPVFADRALQDTYRALIAESAPGGHLDEATWDALAGSHADAARREAAFDHVVACERCSRIWRGVLALREEAETQKLIPRAPVPVTPWWKASLVPLAAAASLLVVIGGLYVSRQGTAPEVTRTTGAMAPIETLMTAYGNDGVPAFVWVPVANVDRYRVEVFTDDGRPVWTREVAQPPAAWPGDIPRQSGTFRWRVAALRGGDVVARSAIVAVEITR